MRLSGTRQSGLNTGDESSPSESQITGGGIMRLRSSIMRWRVAHHRYSPAILAAAATSVLHSELEAYTLDGRRVSSTVVRYHCRPRGELFIENAFVDTSKLDRWHRGRRDVAAWAWLNADPKQDVHDRAEYVRIDGEFLKVAIKSQESGPWMFELARHGVATLVCGTGVEISRVEFVTGPKLQLS